MKKMLRGLWRPVERVLISVGFGCSIGCLFIVAAPALVVACTIDMYRDLKD